MYLYKIKMCVVLGKDNIKDNSRNMNKQKSNKNYIKWLKVSVNYLKRKKILSSN